ncbi:conserved hypothetical protein [Ricinus communis]|uniref:Uncharacterized protein n=1 Tax=Ricinus communis TaxID=3988 RepID=B9TPZ2_RICCO|nr:conserved hypothetical protein [Ricinus communis]
MQRVFNDKQFAVLGDEAVLHEFLAHGFRRLEMAGEIVAPRGQVVDQRNEGVQVCGDQMAYGAK